MGACLATLRRIVQSDREQDSSERSSREFLESLDPTIARMPDGDERKTRGLSLLGRAYLALYEKEGRRADLEKAISLHEELLLRIGPFHPLAKRSHHLSSALINRFQQSGHIGDIEWAISYLRNALNFTEGVDMEKPGLLGNLGRAFQLRFDRLGDLSDLQSAISFKQQAVDMTADGDPDKPGQLNNLGSAFQSRFRRLGNLEDLDDAISNNRRAVGLTPDGHPDEPGRLSNLGNALKSRFGRLGVLQDLEDAISNHRRAVELTPEGHPDKPRWLNNLGNVLGSRFDRLGSLEDLESAISNKQKAVELTPDGYPDKPGRLSNLGVALQSRFERLNNLEDLESALSNNRRAVELTPDGHPDKPGRLSNLGNALKSRFGCLGDLQDLEEAISNHRRAVELTAEGHPEKPRWINNLGNALESRFERLGSLEDLEGAISNKRKAVELTPVGHPDKPARLDNLGNILQSRFERLGILEDLEDAVSNQQRAVELTPDGHRYMPARLNNLGNAFRLRFGQLSSLDDLEGAISNNRRAFELTSDGHQQKAVILNNLSAALQTRFSHLSTPLDLEEAVSNLRKVVELTPDGHPDKVDYLFNLGNAFVARFNHINIPSDLESALSAFSTAANSSIGSAKSRFKAARAWAKHSEAAHRSPLEAFSCAIDLLPRIAWLGLTVTDQHALLANIGNIVRDAVAAAIRYEDYEMAVVWAEQGRSIVWHNHLELRTPVDKLRQIHPELADRLQHIARQLESSGPQALDLGKISTASAGDSSANHSKLAIEWDNIIDEIRKIPGFEGFLRAKTFRQLAPAAYEGPVVIFNPDHSHCDALVLIAEDSAERQVSVIHIPLERFSHEKAKSFFNKLSELLSSAGARERNDRRVARARSQVESDAKFKMILRILWEDVVKPVIDGLAFQTQSERPPRIWWCATGLLAFLPIHAAGLYDTQEIGEKVSDFVVSSYAPTLSSILELSDSVLVPEDLQVLTVAQAFAPGAPPIPRTEDEVRIVQKLTTGARSLNLERGDATVERVRNGMIDSNWIHLACHGQQNPDDPMSSGFLLHDDILKLSEIAKMSLPKAEFAFLSACQTAMGDEKIADESVHLAAGMLLCGCRGVIATTWSIRDDDAPRIAQEVYSWMFKDGKPNGKEAAYALHEAVKLLRESGAECVSWVPFVHIGR